MFAQIQENHDLVWIALIGCVQVVGIGVIGLLASLLAYVQWRQGRTIADTHRMVDGAFGAELDKTATALEGKADATGRKSDVAAAAVARKVSDDKAAVVAAGPPVTPEVPPPGSH